MMFYKDESQINIEVVSICWSKYIYYCANEYDIFFFLPLPSLSQKLLYIKKNY